MTNQDSDGLFENDWEERRELTWTEADWEKYLAEHEQAVQAYLRHYEDCVQQPDRIDEVARRMGWDVQPPEGDETPEDAAEEETEAAGFEEDFDLYTVHRNPVNIATRALYAGLLANWERVAAHPDRIPPAQAIAVLGSLHRGREHALQAVQSLDLGDYTLAVCFFKRALRELNETLARISGEGDGSRGLLQRYREFATPRLFDLREIWLRVMAECRQAEQGD
jgi:hypothetical protein